MDGRNVSVFEEMVQIDGAWLGRLDTYQLFLLFYIKSNLEPTI